MRRFFLAAPTAALLAACSGPSPAPPAAAPPAKAALGAFGVETANMDTTVKPGDDFFKYANGKWLATFKMPADKSRFGAFDALGDKSEADVKTVVESLAAQKPAAGTTAAKVGDMYTSWMDEAAIEARGLAPLQPYLDKINAVTDTAGVLALMGTTEFASPFGLGVEADPQDPTRYAIWAGQDGLGMPDRDYYLGKDASFEKYRAAYKAYVDEDFRVARRRHAGRVRRHGDRARDEDRPGTLAAGEPPRRGQGDQADAVRRVQDVRADGAVGHLPHWPGHAGGAGEDRRLR